MLDALTDQLRGIDLHGAPPAAVDRISTAIELVGWLDELLRGLATAAPPASAPGELHGREVAAATLRGWATAIEQRGLGAELYGASADLRQIAGQLVESLSSPQVVGPAGGVLRLPAAQAQAGDRLISDLRIGMDFPDRPEIAAVGPGGPLGLLVLAFTGDVGSHALGADDPVLVDRPAPAPPVPIDTMAAALAEVDVPDSARGLQIDLVDQPTQLAGLSPADPSTQDGPPAGEPDEPEPMEPRDGRPDPAPTLARIGRLLDPIDPPGRPVADRERGTLWLPSSPRGWAGAFVRREVTR